MASTFFLNISFHPLAKELLADNYKIKYMEKLYTAEDVKGNTPLISAISSRSKCELENENKQKCIKMLLKFKEKFKENVVSFENLSKNDHKSYMEHLELIVENYPECLHVILDSFVKVDISKGNGLEICILISSIILNRKSKM
jgi:hypothetical protein